MDEQMVILRTACSIRHLSIRDYKEHFPFAFPGYVYKGNGSLHTSFFSNLIYERLGHFLSTEFLNDPFIGYLIKDFAWSKMSSATEILYNEVNTILSCLWFLRDNAVSPGTIFTCTRDLENSPILVQTKSTAFTCADGSRRTVEFSQEEIEQAIELYKQLRQVQTLIDIKPTNFKFGAPKISDGPFVTADYNVHHRIDRAMSFLNMARLNSFLALKISLYVVTIECLFTSEDSGEVSHKCAERVARYLGGDLETVLSNYNKVKKAYTVRSQLLHGQKLSRSNSSDKLVSISNDIDDLLRSILNKVIFEDSELFLQKDIEDFFRKLVFS